MTAALSPVARLETNVGAGAKLWTYANDGVTLQATYSDYGLSVPNANPVIASAQARFGPIYLLPALYYFKLTDANDVVQWTQGSVADYGSLLNSTVTSVQAALPSTAFCTTQFNAVTGTTGATLTNVVGMTGINLAAAGVYKFDINISGVSTANCGLKIGFGLTTATLTNLESLAEGYTASAVAVQHTTTATTGMTLFGQTAAVIGVRIAGRLTVNAGGTLAVQAAQNTAHADTTSVYVGSWAEFTRVS